MSVFTKKKIKDFFVYGFGQAINILSPLLVLPFLIDQCGIAAVGKVGVGMSVALILNGIIDYGSYINGVKDISINRHDAQVLEKKFNAIYFSKLLLFGIIFLAMLPAVFFIPYLAQDRWLFLLSLPIVIGQLINPAWFFQGVENFKMISVVNVVSKVIYLVLVFVFITRPQDFLLVNFFFGLGAIVANTAGLFWLMKTNRFSFRNARLTEATAIIKKEFSFSMSQLFLSLYQFSPIILISYFGGNILAGQFRVIDQVVSIFKTYLNMFFYFVYANICFELDQNYQKGLKVWKQYNGFNFALLFVIIGLCFWLAPQILVFFKISAADIPAFASNFRLALMVPLLIAVSQPLRQLMFAFDLNRIYILFTICATLLNFVLLILFTQTAGLKGAFVSIIIIELIVITLYTVTLLKKHQERSSKAA